MMTKEEVDETEDQSVPVLGVQPSEPVVPQAAALPRAMEIQTQQNDLTVLAGEEYRNELFAQCAAGNHERTKTYGICGLLTAIACFPCGLICLFADRKYKCARCGVSLEND